MNILLIEDEPTIAQNIKERLTAELYRVEWANNGITGLNKALFEIYSLIILDILLPGLDGLSILKKLRAEKITTPVLLLTALGDTRSKVDGLDLGADDYLTKPFAMDELSARVRMLLRRKSNQKTSSICIDDLIIDTTKREVTRDGRTINLTSKEFQILEFMAYNKNRALSRLTIAEHIWQDNYDTMTNFVDVHIKNIRKKVDSDSPGKLIQTIRGLGYMIKDE
ncbi:MAG: response regulator transcription factor [Prolixibacteraceae bacterium]|jgi:DNA-binding response OmpR family regulator|nr:response regulator transcription factor [Prolixibacteraceae bacterium]